MHIYVHCSAEYDSQDMETTQISNDRQVEKNYGVWCVEYYIVIRKDKILQFTLTCLGLDDIRLNK